MILVAVDMVSRSGQKIFERTASQLTETVAKERCSSPSLPIVSGKSHLGETDGKRGAAQARQCDEQSHLSLHATLDVDGAPHKAPPLLFTFQVVRGFPRHEVRVSAPASPAAPPCTRFHPRAVSAAPALRECSALCRAGPCNNRIAVEVRHPYLRTVH